MLEAGRETLSARGVKREHDYAWSIHFAFSCSAEKDVALVGVLPGKECYRRRYVRRRLLRFLGSSKPIHLLTEKGLRYLSNRISKYYLEKSSSVPATMVIQKL